MRKIILGVLTLLGIGATLILIANNFLVLDLFTRRYVYFQIIVFLVALGILWRNKGWYTHTNTVASILTMVGVFGTFIGIYIGLQEFNPRELQDSIEVLLDGLKLAFLTSIVGIGSALLLKGVISPLVQTLQKEPDPIEKANEKAVEDVINKFVSALKNVETSGESNLSSKLETLTAAVERVGGENRGVLDDIKSGIADGQNDILKQLETLTTTISGEHNQLREDRKTTRDVLRDMRKDLTDAQGETLKQLETLTNTVSDKSDLIIVSQKDEATETRRMLVDIQSELTDGQGKNFIQLRTLTKTVSYEHNQLRKEFETFSKNVAESITELATKELISSLAKVIENFNTQLSTQFGDNFKQLNAAVGQTVKWQEQYRQDMDKLADEFRIAADSIDKSRDSLKSIADSSSAIADRSGSIVTSAEKLEPILHTLNDQLGAFSNLRQKANDAFPVIEQRLDDLTTEFSKTVQKVITDSQEQSEKLANQYDEFQKVIGGLDNFTSEIGKVTTDVSDIIKGLQASIDLQEQALRNSASYVTTMQTKLDKQLTDSISKLGTNLAALSQQFVKDYTPLTQSLRDVLSIADGILPKQPGN